MSVTEKQVEYAEHRSIVFRMNRKEAAGLARYIKDHNGSPEIALAVDVDARELLVMAKNAQEEDFLLYTGEEDVMEIEVTDIEEEEVVEEPEEE